MLCCTTKIELFLILPSGTTPLNKLEGICAARHDFVPYGKLVPYDMRQKSAVLCKQVSLKARLHEH
jgi:hypothetical protein